MSCNSTRLEARGGQAFVEFLFVLVLLGFIAVEMVKFAFSSLETSTGTMGMAISNNLSVGVCRRQCYNYNFENNLE